MEVNDDVLTERVISAGGRTNFQDALKEFELDLLKGHHMHLLCCEGCILGPGMTHQQDITANSLRYTKKSRIINYANKKMASLDKEQWQRDLEEFSQLDLTRSFSPNDMRIVRPRDEAIKEVLYRLGKFSAKDHLNCGACGYDTCEEHAIAILNGFAESEMCLPYSLEKLHKYIKDLNISNTKLATAQDALRQSEKLAGMGQLSAGIAHELNNPLGVITMYSNILKEELPEDHPMHADLDLIVDQADRCRKIVGGLLNFARKNQVSLTETDVVKLCERSVSSVVVPGNIEIKMNNHIIDRFANIDVDQMMQVVTNLLKNAIEAMPGGGLITLGLGQQADNVTIDVSDSGTGIEKENMDKLFTPFFTTKGIGKGTGLGLPIIYGIVKMHKGNITVKSNADSSAGQTGTTFSLLIPRRPL
jgi:C4-dicarboxylate-specific signal transduction histidine kinase